MKDEHGRGSPGSPFYGIRTKSLDFRPIPADRAMFSNSAGSSKPDSKVAPGERPLDLERVVA
jgi:hypothetical protein